MSRLTSESLSGTLHDAVAYINERGVARVLFALHGVSPSSTIAVFRFDDYPSYQWFCERMGKKPLSTKDYFGDVAASYDTSPRR